MPNTRLYIRKSSIEPINASLPLFVHEPILCVPVVSITTLPANSAVALPISIPFR